MKKVMLVLFLLVLILQISAVDLSSKLPQDQSVKIGKLDNGLTYYIKQNKMPEKKADLRLVVNAGSILEDDNQKGLAHFCEHMAFNGTKHFPKAELTDYLGSIGMGFAGGLNAFTSYDETVYMLESSTVDKEQLKKSVFILSEWANNVSYDNEEIEKERGVIIEEWRGGRGADERIQKKQMEISFKGSKYASHTPIGTYEIISSFKPETIKKFYKDWYRPDLQAVVVVGDVDVNEVEAYIKEYFSSIPASLNPRLRVYEPVPDHEETLVSIVGDKEAIGTNIMIMIKSDLKKLETLGDFKEELCANLFYQMFNMRLGELAQKENPPYLYAYSFKYPIVRTKNSIVISAGVKDNESLKGLEAMAIEKSRIDKYGFTLTELDRAKVMLLKDAEQKKLEMDKQNSNRLIWKYVQNYLKDSPMLDPEQNYALTEELLKEIKLEDVNVIIKEFASEANRVIALSYPDKTTTIVPTQIELLNVLTKVDSMEIKSYQDDIISTPLIKLMPIPGKIISKKYNKKADLYELYLSNGAKVIYKKTDFKNNEIEFIASSLGGLSKVADKSVKSAELSNSLISASGLGDYNAIALSKYLSGHIVQMTPTILDNNEQIMGHFSPQDAETAMQLLYSYFTQIRKDNDAFNNMKNSYESYLQNKSSDPESVYEDTVNASKYNNNPRKMNLTLNDINNMNADDIYEVFKDRFSDASDFVFVFVGAIDEKQLETLVEQYIASLTSTYRKEKVEDRNISYAKGIIEKHVMSGEEDKSVITISIPSDYKYNKKNNTNLIAMITVLNEKLRENIREKMSGVYYVYAFPIINYYPKSDVLISIVLGCSPARVDELTDAVYKELDKMKTQLPEDKYMLIYKNTSKNSWSDNLKSNGYWLGNIKNYQLNGQNFNEFIDNLKYIEKVKPKDVLKSAQNYLNYDKNRIKVVLYPASKNK